MSSLYNQDQKKVQKLELHLSYTTCDEMIKIPPTERGFVFACFRYVEHDALIWEYLNSSVHLAPYLDKKFDKIYAGESYRFYRER